jgi:hypothetical protein
VVAFIRNQQRRHGGVSYAAFRTPRFVRRVSYKDEFRKLLKLYEIEFDERYVWD